MKRLYDLHVHTNRSGCALMSTASLLRAARRRGLHGIAVTDHNTMQGVADTAAQAGDLRIIPAEEIKTNRGELVGYFLTEAIPPGLSPADTIAAIRQQGGLVSVPHPFDRLRSSRLAADALLAVIRDIDLIETFNARDILCRPDPDLIAKATAAGVVKIACSDAHTPLEVGRACMEIEDFETPREFLSALRNGRMIARKSPFRVHIITKIARLLKKRR